MTSDPNEIAEHFNEYFINLAGPNLAVKRPTSLRNFDSYLGESYLNSLLKVEVVTPIFKSNDKESYSNYRTISSVPSCFF